MSSNALPSAQTSASPSARAKRPRLSSPAAAAAAKSNPSYPHQQSEDDLPPPAPPLPEHTQASQAARTAVSPTTDNDTDGRSPSEQLPSSAPRKLKPYRLGPDKKQSSTLTHSSAALAQASLLRDVLIDDLLAEEHMLASLSDTVAAEFSRALIEQHHLRAMYAQWANLPDTDPFWTRPEVLMQFASPGQGGEGNMFAAASVVGGQSGSPAPPPPQDLFATVQPSQFAATADKDDSDMGGGGGDPTDEHLSSLFAYLPVPSSASPTLDAACLDPAELQADEELPLDLDTLEEWLGIAGQGKRAQAPPSGSRPPPRPTQMIRMLESQEEEQQQEMEQRSAASQAGDADEEMWQGELEQQQGK